MELVRAGFGYHVDLRAAGGAGFGCVVRSADPKLRDGIERNIEPRIGLLGLLLHAAGINAVEREVAVVEGVAGKADAALRAIAVINGSGGEQAQAGPVAAADRNFLDLLGFD